MPPEQLQAILSLSITFSHNICQWMHSDHAHIYCNFTQEIMEQFVYCKGDSLWQNPANYTSHSY